MSLPNKPSEFAVSTITELLDTKAEENDDKVFLIANKSGESLTYRELSEQAGILASGFAEQGIGKRDIVTTLMPNSIDHVLVWFACMKLGAIWAPINAEFKHDDLMGVIEDIDPELLVVDGSKLEEYASIRDETIDIPSEFVRGGELEDALSFGELFESGSSPPEVTITPGDPAVIVFTGGTTGKPKPVLHSHFAPLTGAYRYGETYDPRPADRHLTIGQLYHTAGQHFGILGPMLADMSTVILERFSASRFWEQVNRHEATLLDVGGGLQDAILLQEDEPIDNPARLALAAGQEQTHIEFMELFDVDLIEPYSLTEAGGVLLTYHDFEERQTAEQREGKPIGKPGDWGEIAILDEDGARVSSGTVGEICIRPTIPHSMMERYYNNPETTIETWEGLWIHTGDIGWMDENGVIYFAGRQSHLIRRMGETFSSQEVEQVLKRHPSVLEAAVVGVPNETIAGEDAKAFVVADDPPGPGELVAWCEERIAPFKVPRYVEFVSSLPRSKTKKEIERHVLRERGIGSAWDRENQR